MADTEEHTSLIQQVDDVLRSSFGIDPEVDRSEVCSLATTGYVVSCWRNTVLEDIHSGGLVSTARRGSYARDGIPDRDMARLNIATWQHVRPHVHPAGIDVIAVRDLLRDRKRPITIGPNTTTCGELFAGTWTRLAWHLNEGAWLPLHLANRAFGGDEAATVRYYAVCGGAYAQAWFGNPWWEQAITAWAKKISPPRADDLDLAILAPNQLDDDAVEWLMNAGYSESFRDAIQAWKLDRGVEEAGLGPGMWFPPGVPKLPDRLQ